MFAGKIGLTKPGFCWTLLSLEANIISLLRLWVCWTIWAQKWLRETTPVSGIDPLTQSVSLPRTLCMLGFFLLFLVQFHSRFYSSRYSSSVVILSLIIFITILILLTYEGTACTWSLLLSHKYCSKLVEWSDTLPPFCYFLPRTTSCDQRDRRGCHHNVSDPAVGAAGEQTSLLVRSAALQQFCTTTNCLDHNAPFHWTHPWKQLHLYYHHTDTRWH